MREQKSAIPIIQKAINRAVQKPIFASHRPFQDSFNEGDRVLVYVPALDYESSIEGVVKRVGSYECQIDVESDEYEHLPVTITNRSPYVLKIDDMRYLGTHPAYLGLFAGMSRFNSLDEINFYADMIFDARKRFFPKLLEVRSESLPEGLILDPGTYNL